METTVIEEAPVLEAQAEEVVEEVVEEVTVEPKDGDPIVLETAKYKFVNILDAGNEFNCTFGHPVVVGGKNVFRRYSFPDGAEVELPVKWAKELNNCNYPLPKWTKDSNGNSIKLNNVSMRWSFHKVE